MEQQSVDSLNLQVYISLHNDDCFDFIRTAVKLYVRLANESCVVFDWISYTYIKLCFDWLLQIYLIISHCSPRVITVL